MPNNFTFHRVRKQTFGLLQSQEERFKAHAHVLDVGLVHIPVLHLERGLDRKFERRDELMLGAALLGGYLNMGSAKKGIVCDFWNILCSLTICVLL